MSLKSSIKKMIPLSLLKKIRPLFHGVKSYLWSARYGFPGKSLAVIGITGTKGKTTTSVFVGRLMNLYGKKTGYITTSVINNGQDEILNPHKMTTIDGKFMQTYLRQMIKNGCDYVVVEMSSQGLEQHRHWGLGGVDTGVFLNIYPEHIEAHGSFEKYKHAKGILFKNLRKHGAFVGNLDFKENKDMQNSIKHSVVDDIHKTLISLKNDISVIPSKQKLEKNLKYNKKTYPTSLIADFDIHNAYFAAHTIAATLSRTANKHSKIVDDILSLLTKLKTVPGRMEWVVSSGVNTYNDVTIKKVKSINILVDYAHEPASMEYLLKTVKDWKGKYFDHTIHLISCDGVGRDDWKKPIMGKLSHKYIDYPIYTTDNYEIGDNPKDIIDTLTRDIEGEFESYTDRSEAMKAALIRAQSLKGKVLIVSTGVGSEQGLTQPSGTMIWDERDKWIEYYKSTIL